MKNKNQNKLQKGALKMRKYSYLAVIVLLSFVGCMQESNITGPVNQIEKNQPHTIIMLPARADINIEEVFSATQNIHGNVGGNIHLVNSYQTASGQMITIDCELTVPGNNYSFSSNRDITMQVSDIAGVDFYPSMTFNQPVILNFTITGVDLTGIDPENVGFYYVDTNGNLTPTVNDGVSVDLNSGTLKVVNAKLPHFSRWAYAR